MSSDIEDRCLQKLWTPRFRFQGVLLFLVVVLGVEGEFFDQFSVCGDDAASACAKTDDVAAKPMIERHRQHHAALRAL